MRILTFIIFILAIISLAVPWARAVDADPRIVVAELVSGDEKSLNVPHGATAGITVHISSAGELVGDYKVYVVRNSDREAIKTGTSDDIGVIQFHGLPAGEYTLVLSKTQKQKAMGSVQIGDFVLSLDPKTAANDTIKTDEALSSEREEAHE